MQAILQEASLVIAGAWNPAILTPPWVLQHAMQQPSANAPMVQAMFPAGLNGAFDFPRFSMPGFAYTARNDSVIFLPETLSEDAMNIVEAVAERILTQLSHTPIGGVGHNFEFQHNPAQDAWLEPFTNSQTSLVDAVGGLEVSRTTLATSFVSAQGVSVNIQRYAAAGTIGIKFNFHHSVANAADARHVTIGAGYERFWANYQTARRIIEQLYGEIDP
jgi:hypothetical protein